MDEMKSDETLIRTLIDFKLKRREFEDVYKLLEEGNFSKTDDLIHIWDRAHYLEKELITGRHLNPLNRFRIRQRNPPPRNICPDGKRPCLTLPVQAKMVLKQWFANNITNPYPSSTDKQLLATKTGLSINQVKTWFANSRRRQKAAIKKQEQKFKTQSNRLHNQQSKLKQEEDPACSNTASASADTWVKPDPKQVMNDGFGYFQNCGPNEEMPKPFFHDQYLSNNIPASFNDLNFQNRLENPFQHDDNHHTRQSLCTNADMHCWHNCGNPVRMANTTGIEQLNYTSGAADSGNLDSRYQNYFFYNLPAVPVFHPKYFNDNLSLSMCSNRESNQPSHSKEEASGVAPTVRSYQPGLGTSQPESYSLNYLASNDVASDFHLKTLSGTETLLLAQNQQQWSYQLGNAIPDSLLSYNMTPPCIRCKDMAALSTAQISSNYEIDVPHQIMQMWEETKMPGGSPRCWLGKMKKKETIPQRIRIQ